MDYTKFITDVNQINLSTPELAKAIRNVLYAHLKHALQNELVELQTSITTLPSAADNTDRSIIEKRKNQYLSQQQIIREKLADIEKRFPNTPSAADEPLSREHITEFAKAFRDIHHLQRFLVNAPPTLKKYETHLILELLAHLNQEELQTQLEFLPDEVLKTRIENDNAAYTQAVRDQNLALRNQAQNLAQTAALIIIKRKCLACQRALGPIANPVEVYKQLLHDISQCIPDVGSSTIIDDISSTQIPIDAKHTEQGTTTIGKLLYDTRERLGLNRLRWDDPQQLELMLPSRHFYQKLRFGQEDRRIYAAMRRKNLAKDLFMARNIYDVKQFTEDPEKTSDKAFATIEQRNYERRIQELIRQKSATTIAPSGTNQKSYEVDKNSLLKNQNQTQTENVRKLKIYSSNYTLRNLEIIYTDALSALNNLPCPEPLFTMQPDGQISVELNYFPVTTDEVLERLGEAGLVYEIVNPQTHTIEHQYIPYTSDKEKEKIIREQVNNQHSRLVHTYSLPKPPAPATVKLGEIQKETRDPSALGFQKQKIDTKVRAVINQRGGTEVVARKYSGRDLYALLERINTATDINPNIKQAFENSLIKFKNSVKPTPRQTIAELHIQSNGNEAKIRALVELREFFLNYRHDSSNPSSDLDEQEQKLIAIFAHIDNGDYEAAIQIKEIDKIISDAYTWISQLSSDSVPEACRSTYRKSAKIAESTQARNNASNCLAAALDSGNNPEEQKADIRDIFRKEYSSADTADIILPSLGIDQTDVLNDIDLMAEEYVNFAEQTKQGQFTITPEQEHEYERAIQTVLEKIHELQRSGTLSTDLNKLEFKISHKGKATIKENGKEYTIRVNKLPYSLIKSPDSDHLRLSYGGSRGAVAKLPLTQKSRYFTNWRLYGVGQYGTVKRSDDFVTGEGSVIKSGYIKTSETSTYQEALRQDALYRDMTSRDDPNSGTERNVLQAIAWAKKSQDASTNKATEYWSPSAKSKSMYTTDAQPNLYKMVQPLAKGMSYKDQTDSYLNGYPKAAHEFHQFPKNGEDNKDLNNALALSLAIVNTAQEYHALGFTHNDLKPENFMTFPKPDGTYQVEFIDWATGGFKLRVNPQSELQTPRLLFQHIFGYDTRPQQDSQNQKKFFDEKGRFLLIKPTQVEYGIDPSLEILHGGRNCTLPYIAPNLVLGRKSPQQDFSVQQSAPAGTEDPSLTTHFAANDLSMDNWALTALTFGICNRKAYFALARGRAVNDYTVPGVIETQGDDLVIANPELFNQYFSPESGDALQADMSNMTDPNAVMYIPSTLREGQPLHLYQRLQQLLLKSDLQTETRDEISRVLARVHQSVADGIGLNTQELTEQLTIATKCLQDYEQQKKSVQSQHKAAILTKVLGQFTPSADLTGLLTCPEEDTSRKNIEILCTYPLPGQSERSIEILNQIDSQQLPDLILGESPVLGNLLISTIEHHQPDILTALIDKISNHTNFAKLVKSQGLLMYALQQGMTDSARQIIAVLNEKKINKKEIFDLLLTSYGPGSDCPYISWERDALHVAIRNNNQEQLDLILANLPDESTEKDRNAICQALFFSADLLHDKLYQRILDTYNSGARAPIRIQDILQIRYHDAGTSPFHLFLSKSNSSLPPWDELNDLASNHAESIKNFLLNYPYPAVVAAENRNFEGLVRLFILASNALETEEFQELIQQTDRNGANLLNHILNSRDSNLAHQFINLPGMNAPILYKLLKNPHPNNPLLPYLNSSDNTPAAKYEMLNMLLAHLVHLGQDDKIETANQVRNILCANSDWLIAQANDPHQHHDLNTFFSSPWLGQEKLSLFKDLLSQTEKSSAARTYYERQRQAYTLTPGDQISTVSTDIHPEDFADIHAQKGDLTEVLSGLLVSSGERAKRISEASQKEIEEFKLEIEKLKRDIQRLDETNREYKTQYKYRIEEIEALTTERDKHQQEATLIKQIMDKAEIGHQRKLQSLEESLQKNKESASKNQIEMTEKHHQEIEALRLRLHTSLSSIDEKDQKIGILEIERNRLQDATHQSKEILDRLESTLVERNDDILQLKNTQAQLETEIEGLRSRLQTNDKNLKKEIATNTTLIEQLKIKEEQLSQLTKSSTNETQEKVIKISQLEDEIRALQLTLEKKLPEIESLQEKLHQDTQQASLLHLQLQESASNNTALADELQDTIKKLTDATQRALENETNLKLSIHSLEENVNELKEEVAKTGHTLQEKLQMILSLENQLKTTQEQLIIAKQETSQTSESKQIELDNASKEYTDQLNLLQVEVTHLREQIIDLTKTNKRLTSQYNESSEKSELLSQQLKDNKHQLSQQTIKTDELSNLLKQEQLKNLDLEKRVSKLNVDVVDLDQKLQTASRENSKLIEKLNSKEQQLLELQSSSNVSTEENLNKISILQEEIYRLKLELKEKLLTIEELQQQLEKANQKADRFELALKTSESSNIELEHTLQELRTLLTQATERATHNETELKSSVDGLEKTVSDLTEKVDNTCRTLQEKLELIEKLKENFEEVNQQLTFAKRETSTTTESNLHELEQLRKQHLYELEIQQLEIQNLQRQISSLTEANLLLTSQYEKSYQQSELLSQQLKENAHLLSQQQEHLLELSNLLKQEQLKNQNLEKRVQELSTEVRDLNQTIQTVSNENTTLIDRLKRKEKELSELQSSNRTGTEESLSKISEINDEIRALQLTLRKNLYEMTDLKKQLAEAHQKANQLELNSQITKQENFKLNLDLRNTQNQLDRATQLASQTESQLNHSIKSLNEELENLQNRVHEVTQELKAHQNSMSELQEKLVLTDQELGKAYQQNAESTQLNTLKIEELKKQYKHELALQCLELLETKREIQELSLLNQSLSSQNEQAGQRDKKLSRELNEMSQLLLQQERIAVEALSSYQEERIKNQDLERRLETLKESVSEVSVRLENSSKQVTQLTQQLQDKEKELLRLRDRKSSDTSLDTWAQSRLQDEIDELKTKLKKALLTIKETKYQLDNTNVECQRLQQKTSELSISNSQLEHTIITLQDTIQQTTIAAQKQAFDLQQKITSLEDSVERLKVQVQDANSQLANQKESNRDLITRLNEINQALVEEQDKTKIDERKIEILTNQRKDLRNQLDESALEIFKLNLKIKYLADTNERLKKQLSNQESTFDTTLHDIQEALQKEQSEVTKLTLQVRDEQFKNQNLDRALAKAKARISELESEVDELKTEITTSKYLLESAETESLELKKDLDLVKDELQINQEQQEKIRAELELSQQENTSLQYQLTSLEDSYHDLSIRHNNLLKQFESMAEQNTYLWENIAGLRNEYHLLNRQYLESEQGNGRLDEEFNKLLEDLTALQNDANKLKHIIKERDFEITGLHEVIHSKDEKIEDLATECQQLREELFAQIEAGGDIRVIQMQLNEYQHALELANAEITSLRRELDAERNKDKKHRPSSRASRNPYQDSGHSYGDTDQDEDSSSDFSSDDDPEEEENATDAAEVNIRLRSPHPSLHSNPAGDRKHQRDIGNDKHRKSSRRDIDSHHKKPDPSPDDRRDNRGAHSQDPAGSVHYHNNNFFGDRRDGGYHKDYNNSHGRYRDRDRNRSRGRSHHRNNDDALTTSSDGSFDSYDSSRNTRNAFRGSLPDITVNTNTSVEARFRGEERTLPDVRDDINFALGEPHPGYLAAIRGDEHDMTGTSYVRLSVVDPVNHTIPPRKLLDATTKSVTVYRRLTKSPELNPEQKARLILKAMGIPPQEQFDFPDELVVNKQTNASGLIDNGRNDAMNAIIRNMFRIYAEEKAAYEENPSYKTGKERILPNR